MATFELYMDRAGEHRFRLKANNGQIILSSEGYTTKASALNGIGSVKTNATDDARFQRKVSSAGWSFNVMAGNHQVIGTSQVYSSDAGCEDGIEAVRRNAPGAVVVELDVKLLG